MTTPTDPPLTTSAADATAAFNHEQALRSCARGGRQARPVLSVALRMVRQRQQAEDVVHDAFVRFWTKAAGFDVALGSGCGWVYGITRSLALNAVRNGALGITGDDERAEAFDAQNAMDAYQNTTTLLS